MGRPKRPTSDEIAKMLSEAAPMSPPKEPPVPQAPLEATPTKACIEEIDFYEANPRRLPNPQYEAIKESIRQSGLQQPLVVTRRPGSARYVVARGGNTRLKILHELWRETGEKRFHVIDVYAVPWEGEAELLAAHLRENDLRGNLTLLERALAVRRLRELIEEEQGRKLSRRELAEALKTRGYTVTPSRVVVYDYVVDVLHQAVPQALEAGMGRPQVEALRGLEDAFRAVWMHLGLGDTESVRPFFQEVLARHDAPKLDLDAIARALANELAMGADDWSDDDVWLLFQAAREGRDLAAVALPGRAPAPPPEGLPEEDAPGVVAIQPAHRRRRAAGGAAPKAAAGPAASEAGGAAGADAAPAAVPARGDARPEGAPGPAGEALPSWLEQDLEPPPWQESDEAYRWWKRLVDEVRDMLGRPGPGRRGRLPDDVDTLRHLAFKLALLLNYETGTGVQGVDVIPCASGNGFLVGPLTEPVLPLELDEGEPDSIDEHIRRVDARIARKAGWHVLLAMSGQFLPGAPAAVFVSPQWMRSAYRKAGRLRAMIELMERNRKRGDPLHAEDEEQEFHVLQNMLDAMQPMVLVAGMPAWLARLGPRAYGYWTTLVDVVRKIHVLSGGDPWFDVKERYEELREQLEQSGLLERIESDPLMQHWKETTDWKPQI